MWREERVGPVWRDERVGQVWRDERVASFEVEYYSLSITFAHE